MIDAITFLTKDLSSWFPNKKIVYVSYGFGNTVILLTFIFCIILSTVVLTLVAMRRMKRMVSGFIIGTLGLMLAIPAMNRAALGYLSVPAYHNGLFYLIIIILIIEIVLLVHQSSLDKKLKDNE